MELTIYIVLISALAGGITAYVKKDYFSRGFFICLFTGFIGLIAIILSPKSKAKEEDEADYHGWPQYGAYAVLFIMAWAVILFLISLII